MAKHQSKPNYSNPNYPKSMTAGGSKAGRQLDAQLGGVVPQRRAEALARQQQTVNNMPKGPSNINYVQYHDAQQANLPRPGETSAE